MSDYSEILRLKIEVNDALSLMNRMLELPPIVWSIMKKEIIRFTDLHRSYPILMVKSNPDCPHCQGVFFLPPSPEEGRVAQRRCPVCILPEGDVLVERGT